MSATQTNIMTVRCAGKCGATDRVPAVEDKVTRAVRPVALAPWICLECWRGGWRTDGPVDSANRFRIYNLDGREVA